MNDPYWRQARVVRVIDGDTVQLVVSLGFYLSFETRIRLLGIDTPELHAKDEEVRALAREATAFTTVWLRGHAAHAKFGVEDPWPLYIRTEKSDAFGRFLAVVTCHADHDLVTALLEAGLGVPWTRKAL